MVGVLSVADDTKTIRVLVMKVSRRNKFRVRTLVATRPVMPRSAFHLMLAAALTKFAITVVTVTKTSFHMPVAAFGKLIFSLIELVHFL